MVVVAGSVVETVVSGSVVVVTGSVVEDEGTELAVAAEVGDARGGNTLAAWTAAARLSSPPPNPSDWSRHIRWSW